MRTSMPRQRIQSRSTRSSPSLVGPDDPVARLAARSVESPPPAGSSCVYMQDWAQETHTSIVRYCIRDDILIALDRFTVP